MLFQSANLRVELDNRNVAMLWLDVPNQRFNLINRAVLDELDEALREVEKTSGIVGLVIRSAKATGFLAGADIHEFAKIRNADEAQALSARGQQVFEHLAELGQRLPTAALIEGPCLGGGLELALACRHRLAILDRPGTQFGLPEVELGLLPGWGGTQRLPRLIGLENALQVILGGRRLDAREATLCGLIDASISEQMANIPEHGLNLFLKVGVPDALKQRYRVPRRTWRQRLLESNPVGRWLILRGTERILRRRVPEDMPAPQEALNAVSVGLSQGMEGGLAYERGAAGRLATSNACRNLVNLFLQREAARKLTAELRALAGDPVRRVGVVGAGAMGAGIAQLAAFKDCEVVVQEINEAALGAGLLNVAALFKKAVERGLLTQEEAERKLAAVHGTNTWKGFDHVDVVIEAVVEDLEIKKKVFRELVGRTKPDTILATNTSSLSVARLQEGLERPERIAGLHFFNPVHKMPLVEVAHAPQTSRRTLAVLAQWAIALGKTPVLVKDSPGLVVNRVLMPYLSEAVLLVTQKVPVDRIDKLMRRFGMPMGPLELLDQIGLDVAAQVARTIYATSSTATKDPPVSYAAAVGRLFEQMSQRGWLGQKSGSGFYRYRRKRRRPNAAAIHILEELGAEGLGLNSAHWLPPQPGEIRDRLVLSMVNAAAACVGEGLTESPAALDLAMVLGTGWAPHRGGPLHYGDHRGLDEVVRVLENLAQRLGPWFAPCEELRQRAASRQAFCGFLPSDQEGT